jgi:hypothetical protein
MAILKRRLISLIILVILNLCILYNHSFSLENKKCFLIINTDFLDCPLCKERINNLTEVVNKYNLENYFLGVLVISQEKDLNNDKNIKIIERKLKGFIKGNEIKFPIIVDRERIFNEFSMDDICLILFDSQRNMIRRYTLPLSNKLIKEIFFEESVFSRKIKREVKK